MKDPRSKSTATAENAMTDEERDAFLSAARLSRLSTQRPDGFAHTAPCWFLWHDGVFVHSIGARRAHLRNVRNSAKVTECIDVDERLESGLDGRAAAVVCFGEAEVVEDHDENVEWNRRILTRYLPPQDVERYLDFSVAEIPKGRRIVKVHPQRFITWDYGKVA